MIEIGIISLFIVSSDKSYLFVPKEHLNFDLTLQEASHLSPGTQRSIPVLDAPALRRLRFFFFLQKDHL